MADTIDKLEGLFGPIADSIRRLPAGLKFLVYGVIVLYVFMLLSEILGAHWIYGGILTAVQNTAGVTNTYLAKALSFALTMITYWVGPKVLKYWLLFDRKGAAIFTTMLYCGWLVILYFLSTSGSNFVPATGEARKNYYRDANGRIELFPRDFKFHPTLGVELQTVTPEVMAEYAKANGQLPNQSPEKLEVSSPRERQYQFTPSVQFVKSKSGYSDHLSFWVESIRDNGEEFLVGLAVKCPEGDSSSSCLLFDGTGFSSNIKSYLTTQDGRALEIEKNAAHFNHYNPQMSNSLFRTILPGETFRFDAMFKPYQDNTQTLTLHYPSYEPITLQLTGVM